MGLFRKYVNQTRKPEGLLGKLMIGGMNGGHAKLADWGMEHLSDVTPTEIVELGCGGGRNANALLKRYPSAKLTAVDYAALSVEKTKEYNKDLIAAGRCTVLQGDVIKLPFADGAFDLATAFETVYFWPGLAACFTEVCRVLRPGGTFLICNESDGTDETGLRFEKIIDGMKCHTVEELSSALKTAGFSSITVDRYPNKPWITAVAEK